MITHSVTTPFILLVCTFISQFLVVPVHAVVHRPHVTLVLFTPENTESAAITARVEAAFADLPVQLSIIRHSDPQRDGTETTREHVATQTLKQSVARLLFYWESADNGRVRFFVKTDNGVKQSDRELEGVGNLSVEYAIALISVNTVELLLDTGGLIEPAPEPAPTPVRPPPVPRNDAPPRFYVDMGYQLSLASKDPMTSHRFSFASAFRFLSVFRISGGVFTGSPYTSRKAEIDATVRHLGFPVSLCALTHSKRLRIGGGGGVIFLFAKRKLQTERTDVSLNDLGWAFQFEFHLFFKTEVILTRNMAFFFQVGAHIVPEREVLRIDGGETFFEELWHITPFGTAGVQLSAF